MTLEEFQNELRQGIPNPLPEPQPVMGACSNYHILN